MGRTVVRHSPIVDYRGTLTDWHGLWRVADNYGAMLQLRDAWGNRIRCRRTSVEVIEIPAFTEARALALNDLRRSAIGRIPAGRVCTWLLVSGFIEARGDEPGYRLTDLGLIADEALRPFL